MKRSAPARVTAVLLLLSLAAGPCASMRRFTTANCGSGSQTPAAASRRLRGAAQDSQISARALRRFSLTVVPSSSGRSMRVRPNSLAARTIEVHENFGTIRGFKGLVISN